MANILTEAEARRAIGGLPVTLNPDDQEWLEDAIAALTPVIEHYAGPVILRSKTFTVSGGRDSFSLPEPVHSILGVTVAGVDVPEASYWAEAGTGIVRYGAVGSSSYGTWGGPNGGITVRALVGMEQVPANIKLAAKELIRFWWQQGRQGNAPWAQSEQGDFRVPQGFSMPNRVIALIQSGETNTLPGFA